MDLALQPTLWGSACAALAVVGGAPWFSDGLRALRWRRALDEIEQRSLDELPTGFVHVKGRVALQSPLFTPLSVRPCAGFRLEIRGQQPGPPVAIEERRSFRLSEQGISAHVGGEPGRWVLSQTAVVDVGRGDPVSERIEALIARSPEARWMRATHARLVLTERALLAGAECHVVGFARRARPFEQEGETVIARTGTDDAFVTATLTGPPAAGPDLWLDEGGHLDRFHVSDQPPNLRALEIPAIRGAGVVLGPLLSLAGLLYLAHAADFLRGAGR